MGGLDPSDDRRQHHRQEKGSSRRGRLTAPGRSVAGHRGIRRWSGNAKDSWFNQTLCGLMAA